MLGVAAFDNNVVPHTHAFCNFISNENGYNVRSIAPPYNKTIMDSIRIRHPVADVFAFYRNFQNLPSFLGDVMLVESRGPSTSRWTIQGPLGIRVHWTIEVTDLKQDTLIFYETTGLSLSRTRWQIYFLPMGDSSETEVREVMLAPLGRFGRALLALIGKFPAKEVTANLHRLKEFMETGKVTDLSYSVRGKFITKK